MSYSPLSNSQKDTLKEQLITNQESRKTQLRGDILFKALCGSPRLGSSLFFCASSFPGYTQLLYWPHRWWLFTSHPLYCPIWTVSTLSSQWFCPAHTKYSMNWTKSELNSNKNLFVNIIQLWQKQMTVIKESQMDHFQTLLFSIYSSYGAWPLSIKGKKKNQLRMI